MVELWKFFDITHREHVFCNPMSVEKFEELIALLRLGTGDRVIEIASRLSVKPAQIALAWLLRQQGVTSPIIGASQLFHLEESVAALNITISDEDLSYQEQPYLPHPVLGHS